jgi:hypothetical protein
MNDDPTPTGEKEYWHDKRLGPRKGPVATVPECCCKELPVRGGDKDQARETGH